MSTPVSELPEAVAARLLRAARHDSPPVDLARVSRLWPKFAVAQEDLDREGYLLTFGTQGAEIVLKQDDPLARKRFTWAHELGHWVLARIRDGLTLFGPEPVTRVSLGEIRDSWDERWCDRFAANLLMPSSDLINFLAARAMHADVLINGNSQFAVSREAYLSRVVELTAISVIEVSQTGGRDRVHRRYVSRLVGNEKIESAVSSLIGAGTAVRPRFASIVVNGLTVWRSRPVKGRSSWWLVLAPEGDELPRRAS